MYILAVTSDCLTVIKLSVAKLGEGNEALNGKTITSYGI